MVQACGLQLSASAPLDAIGTTGGLAVPDASSLGSGTLAFSLSSARKPQAGEAQKPRSALFGIGLMWAEGGWQRYTDGAQGTSFALSRWWGDIGMQMYDRRGEYQGGRTMVSNASNFVTPRALREVQPAWDLDANLLNAGRLGPEYVMSQLGRMREAVLLFGGR